ncbi:MAG TPA: chemotaxis protein CheB [Pyrinomonadaceae bacterium]|nr:chemotaxis protein CheB [Pyrinomonadaceae bacterium]
MRFEIVVIGASSGGLKALQLLLSELSKQFQLPMVIVQHRGKDSDSGLCEFLARYSELPISEPDDKEPVLGGHVYLAPRDYHLMIEKRSFALSTDAPVAFARPSIDLMFESAADEYGRKVIGLVLTGANSDGARGLARIKSRGGLTMVEDPAEAAFPEMPLAAIRAITVDWVVPLKQIAPLLERLTCAQTGQDAS